ncbi:MAG: helix-turn-helix transcriptional regulator [Dactylosporangium sp.]|nr:helix-turn-helix transcriptional regulator [Dactylosporangium sp.]NNJ59798.1 helix-turn-helix transcriptional regulator [Dactylosporangium sp.]
MVEALARLSEQPADLVLADPVVARPDSAEFARRILAVSPNSMLVFFGSEDPRSAQAAIAAGARGVIRMDQAEPVTMLAKAMMLVLSQPAKDPGQAGTGRVGPRPGLPPSQPGQVASAGVGLTRPISPAGAGRPPTAATARLGASLPASATTPMTAAVPQQRGDLVSEPPRRRVDLTERELQVLRGMADGKSNAEIGRELFVSEDTVKTHARRLFRKLGARDRAHAVAAAFRAGLVS